MMLFPIRAELNSKVIPDESRENMCQSKKIATAGKSEIAVVAATTMIYNWP